MIAATRKTSAMRESLTSFQAFWGNEEEKRRRLLHCVVITAVPDLFHEFLERFVSQ